MIYWYGMYLLQCQAAVRVLLWSAQRVAATGGQVALVGTHCEQCTGRAGLFVGSPQQQNM